MIASVSFQNFKALRDAMLPLERLALIIGPNGSQKSTALESMRMAGAGWGVLRSQIGTAGIADEEQQPISLKVRWPAPYNSEELGLVLLPNNSGCGVERRSLDITRAFIRASGTNSRMLED